MGTAGSGETDRRLKWAVGLVGLAGAIALGWACYQFVVQPELLGFQVFRIAAVTIMLFVASRAIIYTRIRSERHVTTSTEAVTLLALMLLPQPWFIVTVALAVTLSYITLRADPIKLVFNAAKDTTWATAGVLIGGSLGLRGPFVPQVHDLPAILVVAVTMLICDEFIAHPVIALATHTTASERFRTNWDIRLGTTAARLALGIVAMYLLAHDARLVLIVPLVVIGLHFASANQLRERQERDAWHQLAQSTEKFNEVDLDTVLKEAVKRAAELFSADEVDVEINSSTQQSRLVRGEAENVRYDGPPNHAPGVGGNVVCAPLESHDGRADVGELRLRFRRQITLSEREQYTLRAFAAALCTAVRNAAAFAEAQRLSANHAYAAAHDPLTGLANRRQLFAVGDELLEDRA
ncbi:MAG TPA: bifunctional diguanylate cyclase/phosphodiesterase, partial [Rugosimonospora sp.]|nr:bifunctional diguanylate cyclase/phosphodiesterase [Rugosimonospora sp.]